MSEDSAKLAAAVRRWAFAAVAAREMSTAVLTRRLSDKAARRFPDSDPAERARAVAAAVEACTRTGIVDDARFADLSIAGGVARGHSRRRITLTLKEKGVVGGAALAEIDDLAGALRLLRRRRLGPWAEVTDAADGGDALVDAAADADFGDAVTEAPEVDAMGDGDTSAEASDGLSAGRFGGARRGGRLAGRRFARAPGDRALGLLLRNGYALDTARKALALTRDDAEDRLRLAT